MKEKLNSCPFCGHAMKVDYDSEYRKYAIIHARKSYYSMPCNGGTYYKFDTKEEAIETWNSSNIIK